MAWQAEANGNGGCWRISGPKSLANDTSDLISYRLINSDDPSFGVIMHYRYGDSGCGGNREFEVALVCNPSIDNIPDDGEIITEPYPCDYYVEIQSIYGCPLECGRDENNTLCSGKGLCAYDHTQTSAVCDCYAGFGGDICNETVPFEGNISWYDSLECTVNSTYSYELDTMFGYSVHYDLEWFAEGYINDTHYKFTDAPRFPSHEYYLNLFESQSSSDASICNANPPNYDYGYLYQAVTDSPDARCYSLGRTLGQIELYEPTSPTKGIHISLEDGDATNCGSKARRSDIYLICPDSADNMERVDDLDDIYSNYYFSEPVACEYMIEIYTIAACPCQCVSYDENKDSISLCSGNGVCAYDQTLDIFRCVCNDNMKMNDPHDIMCSNPNTTYAPTSQPTSDPTKEPTMPPIESLQCGDYYIGHTLFGGDSDNFTFSVSDSSFVTFDSCHSSFDTKLHLFYANGSLIHTDDDGSCGTTSLIATEIYSQHKYVLKVEGYNANAFGQYHINVTCRDMTLSPTMLPTKTPTSSPTAGYSLYGAWTSYDNEYAVKLSVDQMCKYVKFEFVSPGCSGLWFGFGIGGILNRYALIINNAEVYESTLMNESIAERQSNQNLRDCSIEILDCVQRTVCYRDLMTEDGVNDYYSFTEGVNDIIVAHGNSNVKTFVNATQSAIYLNGQSICLPQTTTEYIDTTEVIEKHESSPSPVSAPGMWRAVGIVFVILFGCAMLFVFYKCYQERHSAPKGYVSRMGSYAFENTHHNTANNSNVVSPRESFDMAANNELGVLNTVVDEEDDSMY